MAHINQTTPKPEGFPTRGFKGADPLNAILLDGQDGI